MREHKEDIIKISLSAFLLAAAIITRLVFPALPIAVQIILFAVPYLIVAWEVLMEAAEGILKGEVFDESLLMCIASIGAFIIGEYPEAVFVMIFFQVGELFEHIACDRSRKSISSLMDLRPDRVSVERDGEIAEAAPEEIQVGDIMVVRAGEKIALDGVIVSGSSELDTSALTGEALPLSVSEGTCVCGGCINLSGALRIRATGEFGQSTVAKILDLVENANEKKAKTERFVTRFSRIYTPAVVILALLFAVVPSVITRQPSVWIYRALMFLVVSCPCALVVSIPLSYFCGIGGASKKGILIKGADALEALNSVKAFVFDKTGTLTRGSFSVTAIHPQKINERELLMLAAAAESFSEHPISLSLKAAYGKMPENAEMGDFKELSGHGVQAVINGMKILVGNARLMEKQGIEYRDCHHSGTIVHVAVNDEYAGHIVISDTIKPDSKQALQLLRADGIKTVMLTGDRTAAAEGVARELEIEDFRAELLPQDKVTELEKILSEESAAFVGDGINDAPCLARADVGVSMGVLGSDAAIEAADVVIMNDSVARLPVALRLAKKTHLIVIENITISIFIKLAVLFLSACGILNMWFAAFADVGVLMLAVLNAVRAMNIKE